jgi:hypothetical protein
MLPTIEVKTVVALFENGEGVVFFRYRPCRCFLNFYCGNYAYPPVCQSGDIYWSGKKLLALHFYWEGR